MDYKPIIIFGAIIGSFIGGYIPTLFGFPFLSPISILAEIFAAVVGAYITKKIIE